MHCLLKTIILALSVALGGCMIEMDDADKGSEAKAEADAQASAAATDDHWLFIDVEVPQDVAASLTNVDKDERIVRSSVIVECPASQLQKGLIAVAIVTADGDESSSERVKTEFHCVSSFKLKVRRSWRLGLPQTVGIVATFLASPGTEAVRAIKLGGFVAREALVVSSEAEPARLVLSAEQAPKDDPATDPIPQ